MLHARRSQPRPRGSTGRGWPADVAVTWCRRVSSRTPEPARSITMDTFDHHAAHGVELGKMPVLGSVNLQ